VPRPPDREARARRSWRVPLASVLRRPHRGLTKSLPVPR
jgi:hypothetical protein